MPYDGFPLALQGLLTASLVVIVTLFAWCITLYVRGLRAPARAPEAGAGSADDLTWVFMVPAMNEEVTIGDSVRRLLEVECANRVLLVIDDGSEDGTPGVLAAAGYLGSAFEPTSPEPRGVQPDRSEEHDVWVGR